MENRRSVARGPSRLPTLTTAGFFCVLVVEAFWNAPTLAGLDVLAPLLFCAATAFLLWISLRRNDVILAVFTAQLGFAFAFESVLGAHVGIESSGLRASPASVTTALLVLIAFVSLVTFVAIWVGSRLRRKFLRSHGPPPIGARLQTIAAAVLFVASLAAAIGTGTWTAYGGGPDDLATGGIRLELVYPHLLIAMLILAWGRVGYQVFGAGRHVTKWVVFAILFALAFALQGRRYLITFLLFALFGSVDSPRIARLVIGRQRRVLGLMALVTATVVAGTFASNAWRSSVSASGAPLNVPERLEDIYSRGLTGTEGSASLKDRMHYLWLDAASIEFEEMLDGSISLSRMLLSSLVTATPGLLYPDKYDVGGKSVVETCEVAFEKIGVRDDLPCTPEAEAFLAAGPMGVLLVAVAWGIALAAISVMFDSRRFLLRLLALEGFLALGIIETSAFPMFLAARNMIIVGGFTLLMAEAARWFSIRPHSRTVPS